MRRILMLSVVLSLMGLLWGAPTAGAESVKLCGSANGLADSLIISGTFDPSGPLVIDTDWVQFVPTVYTLLGGGAIVRTIGDVHTLSGGVTITNNSDAFANNPTCAVSSTLQVEQVQPLIVSGTAQERCIGGPGSPFTVTISFTLIPCNDPGPFGDQAPQSAVRAFEADPNHAHLLPAGYAPNEYRAP